MAGVLPDGVSKVEPLVPGSPAIDFGHCSDVGRVRVRNEDALHVDAQGHFVALADGMGGYRGGDVAAGLAVALIDRALDQMEEPGSLEATARLLMFTIMDINRQIYSTGREIPSLSGMGSTLVVAVFIGDKVLSAHVGDSRLYRLREGVLEQLTRDHTMLQEQVDAGLIDVEEARHMSYRGLLTRGLGVGEEVMPDLGCHEALPGDLFLLCSDGLTDMVGDEMIARLMGSGEGVQAIAEALVAEANRCGGRDNVSAIVARLVV